MSKGKGYIQTDGNLPANTHVFLAADDSGAISTEADAWSVTMYAEEEEEEGDSLDIHISFHKETTYVSLALCSETELKKLLQIISRDDCHITELAPFRNETSENTWMKHLGITFKQFENSEWPHLLRLLQTVPLSSLCEEIGYYVE